MKTFLATVLILLIPIFAIIALVFYAVNGPITIVDSGSTNSEPFTLTLDPNGSGIWTDHSGNDTPFDSFTVDYGSLVKAIRKPEVLKELFLSKPACPKSTSFGTTETLTYNFLSSGDATCVSDQEFQAALSAAISAAGKQAR